MGARREIGLGGVGTIGIGLWLDGVTTKWDRTERLDMVTMGLPGLTGRWKALRVPLFVVDHSWVLRWSMDQAAVGVMPQSLHDGSAWSATDVWRKRRAGRQLLCRGPVCQVTGNWKMFKDIFRFLQHNETHGCCPWCEVTPARLRDTSSRTPWRRQRLEHWGMFVRLRRRGLVVCPLFGSPGFRCTMIRPDWLHIADLGVGAFWIGQLFHYLLAKFAGRTQAERCARLQDRARGLYGSYPCDSKLNTLTQNTLSPNSPAPKVKGYGAEVRGLVPVALHLARELLDNVTESTVKRTTVELAACHSALLSGPLCSPLQTLRDPVRCVGVSRASGLQGEAQASPF